jgi:hypothetical protein
MASTPKCFDLLKSINAFLQNWAISLNSCKIWSHSRQLTMKELRKHLQAFEKHFLGTQSAHPDPGLTQSTSLQIKPFAEVWS